MLSAYHFPDFYEIVQDSIREAPFDGIFKHAILKQNIPILTWLFELNSPTDQSKMIIYALSTRNKQVKDLVLSKCKINPKINFLTEATYSGCLEAVIYARDIGCVWDITTCRHAAFAGHLEILKYLYENGCPWGEWTCEVAASKGHLGILKYAHENGCPWDKWTYLAAVHAEKGQHEVLKYLHENGCPQW